MKGDLHVHTTASDGRLTPAEIIGLAVKMGHDVIAITDHDSTEGVAPAISAASTFSDFTVIPGVEIGTDVPAGEVHILGYFIDYTDSALIAVLAELRDSREGRAQRMIAKLKNLNLNIEWERVRQLAGDGAVGRPHVAQALVEAGHVSSLKEAFDKYLGRDKPAYAERKKMTPVEALRLIINSRGIPVLAHPSYVPNLEEMVAELKKAGLVGLETYYGNYSADMIDKLVKLATAFDLITTGGSDYHAFDDGIETLLGGAMAPPEAIQRLFVAARQHGCKMPR